MSRIYAVKHNISAGANFNGLVPSTVPVITDGVKEYPADAQGGLFEFGLDGPIGIAEVLVKFGGQTSWTLYVNDPTADLPVQSGTTETGLVYLPAADLVLMPGQKLKLVTAGASAVMWAAVLYSPAAIGEV